MKEIGVIKWYHDKATDGKYGFIECPKYDSVFFHHSEVQEGISENSLVEGETFVKFNVAKLKDPDQYGKTHTVYVSVKEPDSGES